MFIKLFTIGTLIFLCFLIVILAGTRLVSTILGHTTLDHTAGDWRVPLLMVLISIGLTGVILTIVGAKDIN